MVQIHQVPVYQILIIQILLSFGVQSSQVVWNFPTDSTLIELPGNRDVQVLFSLQVPPVVNGCTILPEMHFLLNGIEVPGNVKQHSHVSIEQSWPFDIGALGTQEVGFTYTSNCDNQTNVWEKREINVVFEAVPSVGWLEEELLSVPGPFLFPTSDLTKSQNDSPSDMTYNVVFLTDLADPFDGMKQIILQQIITLQEMDDFQVGILDTSCTTPGGFHSIIESLHIPVLFACIELEAERFLSVDNFIQTMDRELSTIQRLIIEKWASQRIPRSEHLVEMVFSKLPTDLQAVSGTRKLVSSLIACDIFVTPNSFLLGTQFTMELARISGVHSRIIDLGAFGMSSAVAQDLSKLLRVNRGNGAALEATANVVFSPSKHVVENPLFQELLSQDGILKTPLYWLPGMVDTEKFRPFEERDEEKKLFKLLFVGNLRPAKGVGVLIKAFKFAIGKYDNMCLDVVGDGSLREALVSLAKRLGLRTMQTSSRQSCSEPGIVVFHGKIKHELLPETYRGSNVFLFPSFPESFGFVTVEALASGLPVVSFGLGGSQDFLQDECTGKFSTQTTPESYAHAILSEYDLWSGKERSNVCNERTWTFAKQQHRARNVALDMYSRDTFGKRTRRVYRALVTTDTPPINTIS